MVMERSQAQEFRAFFTDRELAVLLRCSVAAVRSWRRCGMPAHKFGRLVRYDLGSVMRWHTERNPLSKAMTQNAEGPGRQAEAFDSSDFDVCCASKHLDRGAISPKPRT